MIGRSRVCLAALLLAAVAASPPTRSNDASPPHISAVQDNARIHDAVGFAPDYLRITLLAPESVTLESAAFTHVGSPRGELGRSPAPMIRARGRSIGVNLNSDYALSSGYRIRLNHSSARFARHLMNGDPLNRLTNYAIRSATVPLRLRV
jgi:hypothetical protein